MAVSVSARLDEEKAASNAQILWSACLALARAIKNAPVGAPIEEVIRPLEPEIKAVTKAARKRFVFHRILIQSSIRCLAN